MTKISYQDKMKNKKLSSFIDEVEDKMENVKEKEVNEFANFGDKVVEKISSVVEKITKKE